MEWKPRSIYWKAQSLDWFTKNAWFTKNDKEEEIMDNFVKYNKEDRRMYQQGGIELLMTTCVDTTFDTKLKNHHNKNKNHKNNIIHPKIRKNRMKPHVLQLFNYNAAPDLSSLVQIEKAFLEEEAMEVEAVAYCVQTYFEDERYIYRTFAQDDDTYDQDGNQVIFMDHFMQLLAPGVVVQLQNVAYLA